MQSHSLPLSQKPKGDAKKDHHHFSWPGYIKLEARRMRCHHTKFPWALALIALCLGIGKSEGQNRGFSNNVTDSVDGSRNGKIFSLFSVVQFKNTGCRSQSALASGQSAFRNGTCYTSSECSNKGGSASGNCAAGFGVCCLFLVTSTGSTINQNCTYIRNPGFPSAYTSTSAVTYTISKCIPGICFLRLDFESFTVLGPTLSTETLGGVCPDTFKVTTTTGQTIPTICGLNSGQHIYIDVGNQPTDSATLSFSFTGTSTTRNWEFKVTQVECWNAGRPPNGCLQYWSTPTGRITTFNFLQTTASSNLQNQCYTSCIKSQSGYCCAQYQACASVPNSFTLDGSVATKGLADTWCTGDYIGIQGSSPTCTVSNAGILSSKYCGAYLNPYGTTTINIPICDCTAPFQVHVHTDGLGDGTAGAAPATYSRGTCLDYTLIPCTN